MIATLPRAIRAIRPDVLFCAGNTYAVVAVLMKLVLGRDCPPIIAKISNNLDRADAGIVYRVFYRLWLWIQGLAIDHFVGMEKPMRAEIVQCVRVSPARVAIIPDPALSEAQILALREPAATPRPAGPGRRFVTIARLAAQKNLSLMLRGFARGSGPADTLTVFGDGPERGALEALAASLGIADRVDFQGYVANPAGLLAQYDTLLCPRTTRGCLRSFWRDWPPISASSPPIAAAPWARCCCRDNSARWFRSATRRALRRHRRGRPQAQDARRTLHQARRFTIEHGADHYIRVMRAVLRRRTTAAPLIPEPVIS